MGTVAELRAKIKSGEIKPRTGGGSKMVAGTYGCLLESAELSKGESGNLRGRIAMKIVQAVDAARIGEKINCYFQTIDPLYLEEQLAQLISYADIWGIAEDKIYDDADTPIDVLGNLMSLIGKKATKGLLMAQIELKDSGKVDARGRTIFYRNWLDVALTPGTEASAAPVAAPAPAAVAAPTVAPVVAPTAAPVTAPVTPVATAPAAKKPWQK